MAQANTVIIRDKLTKKVKAEMSIALYESLTLKPGYEAVSVQQHLGELNILGSNARATARC